MRISPIAPLGSLLKRVDHLRPKKAKRKKDSKHLAAIRQCPCLACDHGGPCEPAHLRMAAPGKPITGIGIKPDDIWVLPLCTDCHREQHNVGEKNFWKALALNPFVIALQVVAAAPNVRAMQQVIFKAREGRR